MLPLTCQHHIPSFFFLGGGDRIFWRDSINCSKQMVTHIVATLSVYNLSVVFAKTEAYEIWREHIAADSGQVTVVSKSNFRRRTRTSTWTWSVPGPVGHGNGYGPCAVPVHVLVHVPCPCSCPRSVSISVSVVVFMYLVVQLFINAIQPSLSTDKFYRLDMYLVMDTDTVYVHLRVHVHFHAHVSFNIPRT
jgi:hypothetical protein